MAADKLPEPWLRGILPDVNPVAGHLIRAAQQICEDAAGALRTLTGEQLWATPRGIAPAGFHAAHLVGSTTRLCTYLAGGQLDRAALEAMVREGEGTDSPEVLRDAIEAAFARYVSLVLALEPEDFGSLRRVGRRGIEVTAVGLAIHIVEHGERHVGQLITTAKYFSGTA